MGSASYYNLGAARRGYAAFTALAGKANGFVLDAIDDVVLVRDASTPANNFCGTMEQAKAASILSYASPSTKYVRNSAGVFVPGTTLRRHYDASGSAQGLLSEPQRTNLFQYSEQAETSPNAKAGLNTITSNDAVAPDGTTTMDKIVQDTSTGTHYIYQGVTYTSGNTYTHSRYVKADLATRYRLTCPVNGGNGSADFNLSAVTATVVSGTGATASIKAVGGGIYRISLTVPATESSTRQFSLQILNSSGQVSYTGNGVSGGWVWGAQLEVGAFPTSYIKTEGSTVTRNADNLYVDLTKVPFSATAGTVIAIGQPPQDTLTGGARFWQIDDGTNDNAIYTKAGTAGSKQRSASIVAATAEQLTVTPTTNDSAARFAEALAWEANNAQLVVNGATRGAADTSVTLPTGLTALRLGGGASHSDGSYAAAPLERLIYLPERLSQADMIARTS